MHNNYVEQSELGAAICGAETPPFNIILRLTYFGLCDLGFGCPEMGSASLAEIAAVKLPFGLAIERDLHFEGRFPLTIYADAARVCGGITEDAARLEAAVLARVPKCANLQSEIPQPLT